jgi:hypothetical protein
MKAPGTLSTGRDAKTTTEGCYVVAPTVDSKTAVLDSTGQVHGLHFGRLAALIEPDPLDPADPVPLLRPVEVEPEAPPVPRVPAVPDEPSVLELPVEPDPPEPRGPGC